MKMEYSFVARKLLAFTGLAVMASATGCQVVQALDNGVKGSGKKASETRKVAAFHAIDFTGSGKVDYKIGAPQSVRVETDDNLLPHVETTVKNGKLRVGFKGNVSTKVGLNVTITAPSCEGVELSGSGDIRLAGLNEKHLDAVVSGSGKITASGSAREVNTVVSGSGDIDFSKLSAGDANAQVTGSGNIRVAPAGALNAQITGSGNVRYLGSPKSVQKSVTGSGSITRG